MMSICAYLAYRGSFNKWKQDRTLETVIIWLFKAFVWIQSSQGSRRKVPPLVIRQLKPFALPPPPSQWSKLFFCFPYLFSKYTSISLRIVSYHIMYHASLHNPDPHDCLFTDKNIRQSSINSVLSSGIYIVHFDHPDNIQIFLPQSQQRTGGLGK